jgi:AcrR family transcriptional regulator
MTHPGKSRGAETQTRILERAVQIASVEGLDAMSLATLAEATHMSKSGLFAHFRSKEALQIAIINEAERMFRAVVLSPLEGKQGLERLTGLIDRYVDYMGGTLFQGGCFFAAAVHEFDGRPGLVRDRLGEFLRMWNDEVRQATVQAKAAKEVHATVDPEQVVFWATGIGLALNWNAQMGDRASSMAITKTAVRNFVKALIDG